MGAVGGQVHSAFVSAGLFWPPRPAGGNPAPFAPMQPLTVEYNRGNGTLTKDQVIIARSRHVGGVNASRCDASVKFYNDSIDPFAWNALSSSQGEETVNVE
jgi:hypothetical protein